jgi:hypothetical protein
MKKDETNDLLNPNKPPSKSQPEAGLGLRALGAKNKPQAEPKTPTNEFDECLKQIDGNFTLSTLSP